MDIIIQEFLKIVKGAADFCSETTSCALFYQPKKPDCMKASVKSEK